MGAMSSETEHPMEPISSLPFNTKWKYRPWSIQSPSVLAPGTTRTFFDLRKHGYLILGAVTMNNPNLTCHIELETEQGLFTDEFTATQLILAGWTLPMNSGWFASGVFPLVPSFTVTHSPSPWSPFTRRLRCDVANRTVAPITILAAMALTIEFEDQK